MITLKINVEALRNLVQTYLNDCALEFHKKPSVGLIAKGRQTPLWSYRRGEGFAISEMCGALGIDFDTLIRIEKKIMRREYKTGKNAKVNEDSYIKAILRQRELWEGPLAFDTRRGFDGSIYGYEI